MMFVSAKQAAGYLAAWAIRQSPYACPDNLETVVRRFVELWPSSEFGDFTEFSSQDSAEDAVIAVSVQIPELLAWNDRKNGRAGAGFVSRYDRPSPDDDFIDLDALWRNVAMSISAEEQEESGSTNPNTERQSL